MILRFLSLIAAGLLVFAGCFGNNSPTNNDIPGCGTSQTTEQSFTLSSTQREVTLVTPDANKDCHATMTVAWHWNDDRAKTEEEPPVDCSFEIYPGFFYIAGQPALSHEKTVMTVNGVNFLGWMWKSTLSGAAKGQSDPNVRYQLVAKLRSGSNGPVKATLTIKYYPPK